MTAPYLSPSLLLHFDGADNATSFPDSSGNNLTFTATGSARLYNSGSYNNGNNGFNGTSLSLLGGTAFCAENSAWNFGTGDFHLYVKFKLYEFTNVPGSNKTILLTTKDGANSTGYWELAFGSDCLPNPNPLRSGNKFDVYLTFSDPSGANQSIYKFNVILQDPSTFKNLSISFSAGAGSFYLNNNTPFPNDDGNDFVNSPIIVGSGFTGAYGGKLTVGGSSTGTSVLYGQIDEVYLGKTRLPKYTLTSYPYPDPFDFSGPPNITLLSDAKSSGKWFWQFFIYPNVRFDIQTLVNLSLGIHDGEGPLNIDLGSDSHGVAFRHDGNIVHNGLLTPTYNYFATGYYQIEVFLDLDSPTQTVSFQFFGYNSGFEGTINLPAGKTWRIAKSQTYSIDIVDVLTKVSEIEPANMADPPDDRPPGFIPFDIETSETPTQTHFDRTRSTAGTIIAGLPYTDYDTNVFRYPTESVAVTVNDNADNIVLASRSLSSGKWYWAIRVSYNGTGTLDKDLVSIGVSDADPSAAYTDNPSDAGLGIVDSHSAGISLLGQPAAGGSYNFPSNGWTIEVNEYIYVFLDLDASPPKIYFSYNSPDAYVNASITLPAGISWFPAAYSRQADVKFKMITSEWNAYPSSLLDINTNSFKSLPFADLPLVPCIGIVSIISGNDVFVGSGQRPAFVNTVATIPLPLDLYAYGGYSYINGAVITSPTPTIIAFGAGNAAGNIFSTSFAIGVSGSSGILNATVQTTIYAYGVSQAIGRAIGRISQPGITAFGAGSGSGTIPKTRITTVGISGSSGYANLLIIAPIGGGIGSSLNGGSVIAFIPLPTSKYGLSINTMVLPHVNARGRSPFKWKMVNGVPFESFEDETWVMNLRRRTLDKPEQSPPAEVTNWSNVPAKQFFRFKDKYVFIGTDGKLYEFGGKLDAGAPISWEIKTAMTDFDMIQFKRPNSVYVGGRVENGFTVTVQADEDDGNRFSYPTTRGTGPHTARARIAKGYKARYYGFEISNTNGTADIQTVNIELITSERS